MKELFNDWIAPIIMAVLALAGLLTVLVFLFAVVDMVLDEALSERIKKWLKEKS